jgi:hypothetical protein
MVKSIPSTVPSTVPSIVPSTVLPAGTHTGVAEPNADASRYQKVRSLG